VSNQLDSDSFVVYSIRRIGEVEGPEEAPPGDAVRVDADKYGNVLFRREEVRPDKIEAGLNNCMALARKIIDRATSIAANYHVDTITLKLVLDGKVGLAFVGDASMEAGIEVEIKRQEPENRKPAAATS